MPEDLSDADHLPTIVADLVHLKKVAEAHTTVLASKYIADMECLLRLAGLEPTSPTVVLTSPRSQLETDLEHDEAGRVERTSRR